MTKYGQAKISKAMNNFIHTEGQFHFDRKAKYYVSARPLKKSADDYDPNHH
jgi:hypothetical protein